jgi:molybdopterin synthase sulfur carrier subunit
VPTLRLFASAREAAGVDRVEVGEATVGEILNDARVRFGEHFAAVLASSRVWLNGDPTTDDAIARAADEVAVLPPVSGG